MPITEIDISNCTEISYITLSQIPQINNIRARCDIATVASKVGQAITDATNIGTVQTNYDGAYFNTINTAAVNAGWTVTNL